MPFRRTPACSPPPQHSAHVPPQRCIPWPVSMRWFSHSPPVPIDHSHVPNTTWNCLIYTFIFCVILVGCHPPLDYKLHKCRSLSVLLTIHSWHLAHPTVIISKHFFGKVCSVSERRLRASGHYGAMRPGLSSCLKQSEKEKFHKAYKDMKSYYNYIPYVQNIKLKT